MNNVRPSRIIKVVAIGLSLVGAIAPQAKAQDWSTFDARKSWLMAQAWSASDISGSGKYGMPAALVYLYRNDGAHATALEFTSNVLNNADVAGGNGAQFEGVGVVRALYTWRSHFSATQLSDIGVGAQKQFYYNGGGTENHTLMRWSNGYLLAQEYGGNWHPTGPYVAGGTTGPTVTAAALMADIKSKLLAEGAARYDRGIAEYVSPNYLQHHIIPLLNLYDFAIDTQVRDAARALLILHVAELAASSQRGLIMAPYSRSSGNQNVNGSTGMSNGTVQWNWLYFNQGNPAASRFTTRANEAGFTVYGALSSFRPGASLEAIARKSEAGSTNTTKGIAGKWPFTVPYLRASIKRQVYRTPSYAIGSGAVAWCPDEFYGNDSHFGIAYQTGDSLNEIQCTQAYWYADSSVLGDWFKSTASPYMQVGHFQNTAIATFSVPQNDPWPTRGSWTAERDGRATSQRTDGIVRYPKTIDQLVVYNLPDSSGGRWYFLREGNTYIAIKTLGVSWTNGDTDWNYIFSGAVLTGSRYQTGFIFEVGTQADFGDFTTFQDTIKANYNYKSWGSGTVPTPTVIYTNSEGYDLEMQPNTAYTENVTTKSVDITPSFWVNSNAQSYTSWPTLQASGVTLSGKVLTISESGSPITVNWTGTVPTFS